MLKAAKLAVKQTLPVILDPSLEIARNGNPIVVATPPIAVSLAEPNLRYGVVTLPRPSIARSPDQRFQSTSGAQVWQTHVFLLGAVHLSK